MKFYFKLEDIQYAKLTYLDRSGRISAFRVAVKQIGEQEILLCTKFEEKLLIETPQDITLSIICKDGLYKTKAKLMKVDSDEPYVFFTVSTPQGIDYEQNREYFRVEMQCNCIYKVLIDGILREHSVKSHNISANGISLILAEHIISDSDSDLIINLDGRLISTKIRYIRSEKINEGYKISFMYTKISETDRDYISQICLKKQLEERRNNLRN